MKGGFVMMCLTCLLFSLGEFATIGIASEVINLKWANYMVAESGVGQEVELFAKMLNEASKGRLKVTTYHAEALGKAKDYMDMLQTGACDIAVIAPPYFPGRFPLIEGPELPLLGIPNIYVGMDIVNELFHDGYLSSEFEKNGLKLISFAMRNSFHLFSRNKKISTLKDFKGLKIRGVGPYHTKPFEAYGATTVSMPLPDVPMALERGVLDAVILAGDTMVSTGMHERVKYAISQPIIIGGATYCMSLKKWESLPPDVKLIFEQVADAWHYKVRAFFQTLKEKDLVAFQKAKVNLYKLSDSEWTEWKKAAAKTNEEWIKALEAKGVSPSPREMMKKLERILARYQ